MKLTAGFCEHRDCRRATTIYQLVSYYQSCLVATEKLSLTGHNAQARRFKASGIHFVIIEPALLLMSVARCDDTGRILGRQAALMASVPSVFLQAPCLFFRARLCPSVAFSFCFLPSESSLIFLYRARSRP